MNENEFSDDEGDAAEEQGQGESLSYFGVFEKDFHEVSGLFIF